MNDRDEYQAGVPCWVDAPGFRAPVVGDPQGAALTVGQPKAGP
ncbi:MAG: hypothetical protein ACRDTR_06655 [Rubrobacter sp.]